MDRILILDFGSQYTQLIARRVRELKVYCEIHPFSLPMGEAEKFAPKGIILSGSPASVNDAGHPELRKEILELGAPVLGICFGLQAMAKVMGGRVVRAGSREYGRAHLIAGESHALFKNILEWPMPVWMSHGDSVAELPKRFRSIARTENTANAAIANRDDRLMGVQFHPEVAHTPEGLKLLANFLFSICECKPDWTMESFIESETEAIKNKVNDACVVLGLSGGVDSSVAAVLLHRAIGERLHCIFVDNGLLRNGEAESVERVFRKNFRIGLTVVDARERFLGALSGVGDPEKKRKIIGREFIAVFEGEAKKIEGAKFLAQGTLYPDVIESVSFKGPSATIKSHHNVGGLPEKMGLALIEPFRELFKDEVREVGRKLGLPEDIIGRHPFPGPGLGVRVIGDITEERLCVLRNADEIFIAELKTSGQYDKVWQAFCVLLPVKSVGVMGDERTYENVIALRAVTSTDGMTAGWAILPPEVLAKVSNRIINEVKGVNRVVYDISSKPPATIEWE